MPIAANTVPAPIPMGSIAATIEPKIKPRIRAERGIATISALIKSFLIK